MTQQENTTMDRLAILDAIYVLSQSQGLYGRIHTQLNDLAGNDPERYEQVMTTLEDQKFNDTVDMVLFFET